MDQPTELCDNCQQPFPQSKIGTHFAYCRRNIKKCPTCHQLYDINFQEQHEEQYHKQQQCSYCKKSFASSEIKLHLDNCASKPMYCEYCELNVPVNVYPNHLKECESRTKPCSKCNRPVTNKEYLIHIISCTGPPPQTVQPNNYDQYLEQYRRKFEKPKEDNRQVRRNEEITREIKKQEERREEERAKRQQIRKREEDRRPVEDKKDFQYKSKERVVPKRQEPRKEQKKYIPISHISAISRDPVSQIPRKPETKPEKRDLYKAQIKDYREVKKQQPKFNSSKAVNPQPTFSYNRIGVTSQNRPKDIKSASNKDIFPESRSYKPTKPSNSYERRPQEIRPEVEYKKYPTSNVTRIPAPESKQRVIYESKPREVPLPPPPPPPASNYEEELALGALGISPEQQQLQMAIMQSMGAGKSSYEFESEFNESFIAEQREIEKRIGQQKRKR